MCVCISVCVCCMHAGVNKSQLRAPDSLELKLQEVVSHFSSPSSCSIIISISDKNGNKSLVAILICNPALCD